MNPHCPYYIAPRYYEDPKTLKGYESSAMCDMRDRHYCLVEYGSDCDIYNDFVDTFLAICVLIGGYGQDWLLFPHKLWI